MNMPSSVQALLTTAKRVAPNRLTKAKMADTAATHYNLSDKQAVKLLKQTYNDLLAIYCAITGSPMHTSNTVESANYHNWQNVRHMKAGESVREVEAGNLLEQLLKEGNKSWPNLLGRDEMARAIGDKFDLDHGDVWQMAKYNGFDDLMEVYAETCGFVPPNKEIRCEAILREEERQYKVRGSKYTRKSDERRGRAERLKFNLTETHVEDTPFDNGEGT
jgi:hypothetical protein